MSVEEMIEKLIEFKSDTKKLNGHIEVVNTTEEVREFLADIPNQLKWNGYDEKTIEYISRSSKFAPSNSVAKFDELIEKIRNI